MSSDTTSTGPSEAAKAADRLLCGGSMWNDPELRDILIGIIQSHIDAECARRMAPLVEACEAALKTMTANGVVDERPAIGSLRAALARAKGGAQ